MIYGFDTDDEMAATAALLVYAIYRSRNRQRFKTSPEMWDQIGRFVKDSAKRSRRVTQFVEALMPRLACGAIRPQWMEIGIRGEVPLTLVHDEDGNLSYAMRFPADPDRREFLTRVIGSADDRGVIRRAYEETAWIVLLVRDRLERERPVEARLDGMIDEQQQLEDR